MTKLLYWKLAFTNLWKNRQTYVPFLMASTMLTFTLYSFCAIALDPGIRSFPGAFAFVMVLTFGMIVIGLFAAIFLFYANGFLIKRRKKEMGLYGVLGMEKKHVGRVIRHELSLCYLVSTVLGLGLGILLSRLLFMLVRRIVQVDVSLSGSVSVPALGICALLFAGLYILLMVYNAWQVATANPVDLLRGGQVGEKEPKARWLLTLVGIVALVAGYVIAFRVSNPISAIMMFFIAVVLVVIGTYCLFMAGSLTILKTLKKSSKIFYKPKNFVTISGMLYRMKQNAAGLASICILCTMAMVTVGTTIAMYNGADKMMDGLYSTDVKAAGITKVQAEEVEIILQECAKETGVTLAGFLSVPHYETSVSVAEGQIAQFDTIDMTQLDTLSGAESLSSIQDLFIMTQQAYNSLGIAPLELQPMEMAWCSSKTLTSVSLDGNVFTVREANALKDIPSLLFNTAMTPAGSAYLVVPNADTAQRLVQAYGPKNGSAQELYVVQTDIAGSHEQKEAFYARLSERTDSGRQYRVLVKESIRGEFYSLVGGFLFVGIFLGILFMMATALIIYFKQISEGYQDQDRFVILQKVGMSQQEVRATVRTQILIVFFLPLIVALCHVAGSLHMISLMLAMFSLTDVPYIVLNTLGAALIIGILYSVFYLKTNRTYYNLVKM